MTRFLRFVVETTLDGNSAGIKEYTIAIEVFEKAEDYDPQVDSTVRTEASKLRSKLRRYYDTEGREDPVLIAIPKGSYVPTFEDRRNGTVVSPPVPSVALPPTALSWLKVSLLILAGITVAGGIIWLRRPPPSPAPRLVPLTSYPELEEQASISPDGSQVAFRWKGDIYVKQVGAEAFVQVTKDPAVDSWPAWSPDGSQIAFVRNGEVFLVSPLGGAERKVAESVGRVAWMKDGSALLVLQKTSPYARSLFRVSLASGEKRRLTFPKDLSPGDTDLAVSPDGSLVVVCRSLTGEGCDLYIIPAAGGSARRLTNDRRTILGLAWTPDGRQIVFSSNRQGWFRLWRVAARPANSPAGYETPVLVEGGGDDARYPSISRGSRLVYQRYTRNFDINRAEIAGAEGTPAHRLKLTTPLITSTRLDVTPSWSPDGKKIAFVSDRLGARDLWICEADSSNPLKLTSFAGASVIYPRWSPDGRRLVFSALTGPDGNFESYALDSRGGTPERIDFPGHQSMAHPVFSHDGRWLYFIQGAQDGGVEAWKMPATGGEPVQITRHGGFRPEESPDGKLLYYGKYGAHGLWSAPITGGAERRVLDSITEQNWTVASEGIYYIDFAVAPAAPKLVKFYRFKTGKINEVGTVEPTVSPDFSGISVSPDGRWLLYSHIANVSSDLMLVDHFR